MEQLQKENKKLLEKIDDLENKPQNKTKINHFDFIGLYPNSMEELQNENKKLLEKIDELENKPKRIESLKKAQNKYYNKNKTKINKYKGEYNKEYGKRKFECECGQLMPFHSKAKHLTTKKHQELLKGNHKYIINFITDCIEINSIKPVQKLFYYNENENFIMVILDGTTKVKITTLPFEPAKIRLFIFYALEGLGKR